VGAPAALEDDLHRHPNVLDQLRVRRLALLLRLLFRHAGPADLGQVGENLLQLLRQFRHGLQATHSQAEQEAAAPGAERRSPFAKPSLVARQQEMKCHPVFRQGRRCRPVERLQHGTRIVAPPEAVLLGVRQCVVDPALREIRDPGTQQAAQRAMCLGGGRAIAQTPERHLQFSVSGHAHPLDAITRAGWLAGGGHGQLTVSGALTIVAAMDAGAVQAVDVELKRLERRLDELVAVCRQLKEENRSLRQRQDNLILERASLLQKNEQVRTRVEAMIGRLKAMEHGS
jgi:cell division protein ZapB